MKKPCGRPSDKVFLILARTDPDEARRQIERATYEHGTRREVAKALGVDRNNFDRTLHILGMSETFRLVREKARARFRLVDPAAIREKKRPCPTADRR